MVSKRIVVSGRVQGVGFRYYVDRKAQELGVYGYVRNLPNGKLEVEAEGDDVSVETLIDYCRIGPARALVDRVEVHSQPVVGYTHFGVR
ncbi:acylphosphatase [uncultured Acetobacteroides sp.]|uniref:acylphosphatase n=1 Tax=uncultured Acetobacteroides sp. TaxID=1760811 RepID=UPI0029F4B446|nr:acylphosphatase [uncultured Acetobacteroides sp.]